MTLFFEQSILRTFSSIWDIVIILKELVYINLVKNDRKYKYHFLGEHQDFGIVLSGQIFEYKQKKENELKADAANLSKQKCFNLYTKYLQENNYSKLLTKCSRSYSRISLSQSLIDPALHLQTSFSQKDENREKKCELLQNLINEVLKNENEVIIKNSQEKDLSIEEKLLLLNNRDGSKCFIKDGLVYYKKVRQINCGKTIGEAALSVGIPAETVAVASDDVHIITISKKKMALFYNKELKYFEEKKKFFSSLFPDLDQESLLKLCLYVEEKSCHTQEYLYNQGEEPNAIFFVKSGKVQVYYLFIKSYLLVAYKW